MFQAMCPGEQQPSSAWLILSQQQTQAPSVPLANCWADEDCPEGETGTHSHAPRPRPSQALWRLEGLEFILCFQDIKTGRKPLLIQAQNFTLFIKNTITFSKFNFSKSNALETWDPTYFKHCQYDPRSSPYCPVFRIGDLVATAGGSFEDLALLGGSVGISVCWDCDLDTGGSDCQPRYSFQLQERSYNFRTATHWWEDPGVEAWSLLKLYGIRFDILVTGQAGKFGLIPTAITLGTGAAWLGTVTFLCDLLLLYVDREAHFYWRTKYEEVRCRPAGGLELRPLCPDTEESHTSGDVGPIPDLLSLSAGKGPEGKCQLSVEQAAQVL
ncbi:P2X purinoceptor 6-like [Nycticebus coucang]|uniref:P2X purinoceptor 6-like n=1 Tax=Nycticebus coucang TaxID=9470 RepID=UPI00234D35C1|nr:P2X purinoceptor 6-like [Nycticebus coucang]